MIRVSLKVGLSVAFLALQVIPPARANPDVLGWAFCTHWATAMSVPAEWFSKRWDGVMLKTKPDSSARKKAVEEVMREWDDYKDKFYVELKKSSEEQARTGTPPERIMLGEAIAKLTLSKAEGLSWDQRGKSKMFYERAIGDSCMATLAKVR